MAEIIELNRYQRKEGNSYNESIEGDLKDSPRPINQEEAMKKIISDIECLNYGETGCNVKNLEVCRDMAARMINAQQLNVDGDK